LLKGPTARRELTLCVATVSPGLQYTQLFEKTNKTTTTTKTTQLHRTSKADYSIEKTKQNKIADGILKSGYIYDLFIAC